MAYGFVLAILIAAAGMGGDSAAENELQKYTSILLLSREIVLFALLVIVAYTDVAMGKVYNWTTYPAIFMGLAINYLIGGVGGDVEPNLLQSLIGFVMGLGVFVLAYFLKWVGAGDVKLAAAIGALGCWPFAIYAIFYSSVVGAVMSLAVLIWHGKLWDGVKGSVKILFRRRRTEAVQAKEKEQLEAAKMTIPYGLALAVGTMWAWFMYPRPPLKW